MKARTMLLSICIPNYNRPEMLAKNLEAIAREYINSTEIVIVDDCSPQPVDQVIVNFKTKYPQIKLSFYKNIHNLGFDKNVLKVISKAHGKYCWLLSNDDTVLPQSIKKVTDIISQNSEISLICLNYQCFDQLQQKITVAEMAKGATTRVFHNPNEFFFLPTPKGYFKYLGINTLTMSINIIRREWFEDTNPQTKRYVGKNMIHVFGILTMLKRHPDIYYVQTPMVQYLSNNHRVWPNDIWKDYEIFVLGLMKDLNFDEQKISKLKQSLNQKVSRMEIVKNLIFSDPNQLLGILIKKARQLIRI